MTDIDEILNEREKTHGHFSLVAEIHAAFIDIIDEHGEDLSDDQRISLISTTGKMARVLAGDPKHIDHWRDMSGYPALVVRELEKKNTSNEEIAKNMDEYYKILIMKLLNEIGETK